jgi:hypothetical protein
LLSRELMVLVIRQEPVELQELEVLAELPELDVLVPAAVVEQGELEELEEAILVWLEVLLVALLVNLIQEALPQRVQVVTVVLPQEDWLVLVGLAGQVSAARVVKVVWRLQALPELMDK